MFVSPFKKSTVSIHSSERYWWSKNPPIWLHCRYNWQNPNSDPSFCWWLSPCKKSVVVIDFLQIYWWSNNPSIWLTERHSWPHPTKSVTSLKYFLPLRVTSKQKSKILINCFKWYWQKNKAKIWLWKNVLAHNWRNKFFLDLLFSQNHKKHCCAPLLQ